jgi:hypothetical protein
LAFAQKGLVERLDLAAIDLKAEARAIADPPFSA